MDNLVESRVEIKINEIENCEDLQFVYVKTPCFLDYNLEPQVAPIKKFDSFRELIIYLNDNNRKLYIFKCEKVDLFVSDSFIPYSTSYDLRSVPIADKKLELVKVISTSGTKIGESFCLYREALLQIDNMMVQDLITAWGLDEAAKQIGESVLRSFKK